MRRRIREVRPRAEPIGFAVRVEAEARRIIRSGHARSRDRSTSRTLERRLALALDHLDTTRKTHARIRRSLDEQEASIRIEIRRREPRPPVYADPRLPERDMLRGRLLRLGQERRRLLAVEHAGIRDAQDRLAQLVELAGWRYKP